jgi:hypothetical protein
MEPTKNLQDLEINKKYEIMARKEITTKFGKSYILQVTDESGYEFELYSTKYIASYIDKEIPKGPFKFIVKVANNAKYAEIENYSKGFIPF